MDNPVMNFKGPYQDCFALPSPAQRTPSVVRSEGDSAFRQSSSLQRRALPFRRTGDPSADSPSCVTPQPVAIHSLSARRSTGSESGRQTLPRWAFGLSRSRASFSLSKDKSLTKSMYPGWRIIFTTERRDSLPVRFLQL